MSPRHVSEPGSQQVADPLKETLPENSEMTLSEGNSEFNQKSSPNLSQTPAGVLEYLDLAPSDPVSLNVEGFTTFTFDPDENISFFELELQASEGKMSKMGRAESMV